MFTFTKSRPIYPIYINPPDGSAIREHPEMDESQASFNRGVQFLNYISEMFKFVSKPSLEGMDKGFASTLDMEGIGEWKNGFQTPGARNADGSLRRGYAARGIYDGTNGINGDYGSRYGDVHTYQAEGTFWGYNTGEGAKNLKIVDPAVNEFNHFSGTITPQGGDLLFGLEGRDRYYQALYGESLTMTEEQKRAKRIGLVSPRSQFGVIDNSTWEAVQRYLSSFNGKSYFDIALTGIENSRLSTDLTADQDINLDGILETGIHTIGEAKDFQDRDITMTHQNGFLYDGTENFDGDPDKGAYMMLLSIVQSRRLVNYGMSYVFGSFNTLNDTEYTRQYVENTFTSQDKLGGLSPYTKQFFTSLILENQHPYRSLNVALTGGAGSTLEFESSRFTDLNHFTQKDKGFFGYIYDVRTQMATQRFRNWLIMNAQEYVNRLPSGNAAERAAKTNAQALIYEARFQDGDRYGINQPYGADEGGWYGDHNFMGWDRFSSDWSNAVDDGNEVPYGITPYYDQDVLMSGHRNYTSNQLVRLNESQIIGEDSVFGVDGAGHSFNRNLYGDNWAVYALSQTFSSKTAIRARIIATTFLNEFNRTEYKREMKEYKKGKEKKLDEKYEESLAEAKRQKVRSEIMAGMNKKNPASKPKVKIKPKASSLGVQNKQGNGMNRNKNANVNVNAKKKKDK